MKVTTKGETKGKFLEFSIGEHFTHNEKTYKAVSTDTPCEGCVFNKPIDEGNLCLFPQLLCAGAERKDGKEIVFKEVKR